MPGMELLVLGGTAFLGRAVARAALDLGHRVTCLARGSAPVPDGARFVAADRDRQDALAPVADTPWDAVVDVTSHPGQARRAVRDLTTGHRVYVSSANVYTDTAAVEQDETAAVHPPLPGERLGSMSDYGPGKVACEQAVRAAPGPSLVVRAGLIGGPGDGSGRSGYWPWRFAHPSGPDVLVPDAPAAVGALVDVRDLAAWIVSAAQDRVDGVMNATGPTTALAEMLGVAAQVGGSGAPARAVSPARLAELGVVSWMGPMSLPLWLDDPAAAGFGTLDCTLARAAGLRTRPLAETFAGALEFEEARTGDRPTGLTDEQEQRVRAALEDGGRSLSGSRPGPAG